MSTKAFYQGFLFVDMSITEEDRWKKLEKKVAAKQNMPVPSDAEVMS